MKIVLMVAAGIAVGFTVVLAVLIQVVASLLQAFERLAPLLVVAALVVLGLHVVRRRGGRQDRPLLQAFPMPAVPPAVAPPPVAPAELPPVGDDHQQPPYLRWGPPAHADLDARPVSYGAPTHLRRARVGAHPSRAVRGRRP